MNQTQGLHGAEDTVGTASWVQHTSGRLTTAPRRALLGPLARTHVANAVGRLRLAVGVHPGRHADVATDRITPPTSALTRAAEQRARLILPTPLLNHSYRSYVYGRALGRDRGDRRRHRAALPPRRLNVMRVGLLVMASGSPSPPGPT